MILFRKSREEKCLECMKYCSETFAEMFEKSRKELDKLLKPPKDIGEFGWQLRMHRDLKKGKETAVLVTYFSGELFQRIVRKAEQEGILPPDLIKKAIERELET